MYKGSVLSTCDESIKMPGKPVTWSAWVWDTKIASIFFHFRFNRFKLTCVPSPPSNKNKSPSRRNKTEVRWR